MRRYPANRIQTSKNIVKEAEKVPVKFEAKKVPVEFKAEKAQKVHKRELYKDLTKLENADIDKKYKKYTDMMYLPNKIEQQYFSLHYPMLPVDKQNYDYIKKNGIRSILGTTSA